MLSSLELANKNHVSWTRDCYFDWLESLETNKVLSNGFLYHFPPGNGAMLSAVRVKLDELY